MTLEVQLCELIEASRDYTFQFKVWLQSVQAVYKYMSSLLLFDAIVEVVIISMKRSPKFDTSFCKQTFKYVNAVRQTAKQNR